MSKITIDTDKCVGCGLCEQSCPEVFELNDEGLATVKSQEVNDNVKEAVEQCPVEAIRIE